MPIELRDAIALDGMSKTRDGYVTAFARVARTGIQEYSGREVGKPDMARCRVYRPEAEVFNKDALRSFAWRPVTNDHPPVDVNAETWRDYAVGQIGPDIVREGDFVRVPLVLMDQGVIDAVENGKRQLSMGYWCDLVFQDGIAPDGQPYDAIQTNIRGNHLAVVTAARGGPDLKLGDNSGADMTDKLLRKVIIDGIAVEMTDTAEQIVTRTLKGVEAALTDSKAQISAKDAEIAVLKKAVEAKDGEIAGLKKIAEDAKPTAAQLDAMATERADVIGKAKAVIGDAFNADGKSSDDIKREVVVAKMGDSAIKDKSADYVQAVYDTLTATTQTSTGSAGALAGALAARQTATDQMSAYDAMVKRQSEAWKH